jgi:hypothetical protein
MAKRTIGTCLLTGERGKYVKCHIIPRALMRPHAQNEPMIYWYGEARRPVLRWNSWYDAHLVTRAGEDILEQYDTWAINELRKHHLIWSSWVAHSSYTERRLRLVRAGPVEVCD